MNDTTKPVVFEIEDGVAIPARTLPNAGPRESMYPLDNLQKGQGFAISLADAKDGDFSKASRQKQSQMSSLAKTRKISLITRFFDGSEGNESPFKSVAAPCLGVWHDGPAKEKKAKPAPAPVDPNAQAPAPVPPAAPAAVTDEAPLEL